MEQFLKCVGLLALSFLMFYFDILIMIRIYNLTILPLGGPAVNWIKMYGVSLFLRAATFRFVEEPKVENYMVKSLMGTLVTTGSLLIGWGLAHLFFG